MKSDPVSSWPVLSFDYLEHIGTMKLEDKGSRFAGSYEGDGLSVSNDADAWEEIAELGGLPRWVLYRADGQGWVLDVHRLSPVQKQAIEQWAVAEGWLRPAEVWMIKIEDDELEQEYEQYFKDFESANFERYDGSEPTKVQRVVCTTKLLERLGWLENLAHASDGGILVFAEDVLGVDGVWWEEELRPESLSAPRGVIFKNRLVQWQVQPEAEFDIEAAELPVGLRTFIQHDLPVLAASLSL